MHPYDVQFMKRYHRDTGLPYEEIKQAFAEANGDGQRLLRILDEKRQRHPELANYKPPKPSAGERITFGKIAVFVISKLVGSIFTSALVFAGIIVAVVVLRGEPVGNIFSLIARNWWMCLAFGVFITFFRLFESDFCKSQ